MSTQGHSTDEPRSPLNQTHDEYGPGIFYPLRPTQYDVVLLSTVDVLLSTIWEVRPTQYGLGVVDVVLGTTTTVR